MTTHEQTARNAEIVERRLAGEATGALALEYRVTPTRIAQLVRRHREKVGEIAPRDKPIAQPKRDSVRPRLRLSDLGLWECFDSKVSRRGETPREAYGRWLTAAIALAQPSAQQLAGIPGVPEQPYAGPVTVVPGTRAAPRALALPPAMRFAMERAGLVQSRLITLPGT